MKVNASLFKTLFLFIFYLFYVKIVSSIFGTTELSMIFADLLYLAVIVYCYKDKLKECRKKLFKKNIGKQILRAIGYALLLFVIYMAVGTVLSSFYPELGASDGNTEAIYSIYSVAAIYLVIKTLIFATGNKKNTPKIKGIKELEGKGISYCAICDGFFYRNKNIAVLGSGKYAISETNELINLAKEITILTNGEKAPEIRADNVKIDTRKIKEVRGEDKVEEVEFEDNNKLKTEGIFVAQGVAGSSEFAKKLGIITKNDKIIVDENMKTNIKGIYACGDCTGGLLQISKAVYEGTKAGLEVIKYLREK